jgi:starch phosphorylase
MKFALNGALTIGTLDGANVEIRDAVGADNFFLFGMTEPEVRQIKTQGYRPWEFIETNPELKRVMDSLVSGLFSEGGGVNPPSATIR